jgi:hypothetical protein
MASVAPRGKARKAQILFGNEGDMRAVKVFHPGGLTRKDIADVNNYLIDKVIFDLTGCSCLSGTIDVIWERDFDRVITVDLEVQGAKG